MNDAQLASFPNTRALINFAIDLLLGIFIGFLISVLVVMLTILIAGPEFSIAEIKKVASQIFSPDMYGDTTSSMVFLVPIISSVLSISIARNFIKLSATRKSWVIVTIVVVITASLAGILSTMEFIGPVGLIVLTPSLITVMSPIGIFLFLVALSIGLSLGIIFLPKKHIVKILMAAIAAALVGGLFELVVLGLALYEAF